MKKEVLFRGIDVKSGKMVEGLPHFNAAECCLQITEFVETSPTMSDPCGDQFNLWHNIKPETLGEFTGRFDAQIDGKRIFEDDIIQNVDTKDLQVVFWNEDKAAWYCRYVSDPKRIVSLFESLGNLNKKVGNIWNNPELINEAV